MEAALLGLLMVSTWAFAASLEHPDLLVHQALPDRTIGPQGALNPMQSRSDHELQSQNGEGNERTVNAHVGARGSMGVRCSNGEQRQRCQNQRRVHTIPTNRGTW
jgi:hypothetical protein